MDRHDQLIHAILDSAEFASAVEAVASVLHEPAAREAKIAEFLASIAPKLSHLDSASRPDVEAILTNALLARSLSQAPAAVAPPGAPVLRGNALSKKVRNDYPQPIAKAYHTFVNQGTDAAKFGCLITTFEALAHYLAAVALSAYVRAGLPDEARNRKLTGRFIKRGAWQTGEIVGLLRETLSEATSWADHLPYPQLIPHLFNAKGKPTPSHRLLELFTTLRNSAWGHGTNRTEAFFAEALATHRVSLEDELSRLSAKPGDNNPDPWYDGRAQDYTIVDAHRAGSKLAADEIEAIFLEFGGAAPDGVLDIPTPTR